MLPVAQQPWLQCSKSGCMPGSALLIAPPLPLLPRSARDRELQELGTQAAAAEAAQLRARELESSVRELRAQLRRSEEEVATLQVCGRQAARDSVQGRGGGLQAGEGGAVAPAGVGTCSTA